MPSFSDVYASVKLDLDADEERRLKKRLEKIDTKDAGRKMGVGLSKSLGGGFRASIGGAAKSMFGPLIAAGAAIGGFQLFKGFIEDAAEAAKISRITASAISDTGGAAKISAQGVADLSQALSNQTAIDDELVQTGANLLLTFKNIRNEVGAGNDIFNQATAAALDLSAAGYGTVEASAIKLGKALNDPIKGIAALGKAGVQFSVEQKEQIKNFVETGDMLSAQKIILTEIAEQMGTAAEAAAGPMDRLKVIAGNLGEEIGTVLLPFVEQFATWLATEGATQIQSWIAIFRDEWIPTIKNMIVVFRDEWWPVIREVWGFVVDLFEAAWPVIKTIYDRINTAGDRWSERLRQVLDDIGVAWGFWRDLVIDAWEFIKRAFEDGVRAVANFMLSFAETILDGAEAAFGWIPGIGDKLRGAQGALADFKRSVNKTLSEISDEEVVIKVTAAGAERVARSAAASAAARFQGGLEPGQSSLHPFIPDGTGGNLGIRTTGLNPEQIGALASGIAKRAGNATFAEIQRLFKAGAFFSAPGAGPGIPGSGRLFPLPPGTYRRSQGPHDGGAIDYAAPYGTPVRASFTGTLDISDLGNRSYGKFYRLFGPGQRSILGAHLSSFSHGDGPIQRGQMIGRVGSTGNSTGPHLHLLGFDKGGWLPTGASLTVNQTGQPERIIAPHDELELSDRTVRRLGETMGRVVLAGIGAASHSSAQAANLYTRTGG